MTKLNALKPGDKIGIYSPSAPATVNAPKRFARAKQFLEDKGFIIVEGCLTGKSDFYRSGTIKERAKELNELIRDPEIKCIMSTIGGMNSNSMLPYIDYEAFRKNPKILIGYSDVTAILLAIYEKTGIPTFYGPALIPSFGELEPFVNVTFEDFSQAVKLEFPRELKMPAHWSDERVNWEDKTTEKTAYHNEWVTVHPGIVTGRLIGGNLNTISGIFGTPYMPEIKQGDILLLEDSYKDAATIERYFSMLKLAGVFEKISGLIYGKLEQFDDSGTGRKPYEILLEVLNGTKMPFLADFDCSHTHPMLTLPIGSTVKLDATAKKVTIVSL